MTIDIPPLDENPSDADVHFLEDEINRYNFETTGITAPSDCTRVVLTRARRPSSRLYHSRNCERPPEPTNGGSHKLHPKVHP